LAGQKTALQKGPFFLGHINTLYHFFYSFGK